MALQFPYNPTQLLLAPNAQIAYVLQPSSSGLQVDSLDLASQMSASSPSFKNSSTPLMINASALAISSAIGSDGTISVYAGDCTLAAAMSQVWTLPKDGSWTRVRAGTSNAITGTNFLSTSIAFAGNMSVPISDSKIYNFGGACSSTYGDTYSEDMLRLSISSSSNSSTCDVALLTGQDGPRAEAGQTLTPLTPTYSFASNGTQEVQQAFLLMGGQISSSGFMNISNLALFSLPAETWSFISTSGDPSLMSALQPRSGHSAVLTSDGKQVIVYGGYAGDAPATPDLLVLNVSSTYGGSGNWIWTSPSASGTGPSSSGSGLYGHGAAMLPGNVMMITGGYSLSGSSAKTKRQSSSASNRSFLYNVSSNSWIDTYNAPANAFQALAKSSSKDLSVGVIAGIAAGAFALIVAVFAVIFWYLRRKRYQRWEQEDSTLRQGQQGMVSDEWGNFSHYDSRYDRSGPEMMARFAPSDLPSETAGPSRPPPVAARYGNRQSRGGGRRVPLTTQNRKGIETIAEGEEQGNEDELDDLEYHESSGQDELPEHFASDRALARKPVGLGRIEHARSKSGELITSELNGWGRDWQRAGEGLLSGQPKYMVSGPQKDVIGVQGRTSPTKSDRTTSSLSSTSAVSSQGRRSLRNPFKTPHNSAGGSSVDSSSPELNPEHEEPFAGSARQTGAEVTGNDNTISRRMRKGRTNRTAVTDSTFSAEPSEQLPLAQPPQRQNSLSGFLGRWMPLPGYRSSSLTSASRPMSQVVQSTGETTSLAARPASYASAPKPPQRSASDASFWAKRQGANDWGAAEEHEGSGDWDVEGAIQNRVVQQMFTTVPRETLRVVNVDVDDEDVEERRLPVIPGARARMGH